MATPLAATPSDLAEVVRLAESGRILPHIQHCDFFQQPVGGDGSDDAQDDPHHDIEVRSVGFHGAFLILCMLPIVLLSKKLAVLVDHGISTLGAPQALGGFLVISLLVSVVSLSGKRTNILQGAVHLIIFLAHVVLIFD